MKGNASSTKEHKEKTKHEQRAYYLGLIPQAAHAKRHRIAPRFAIAGPLCVRRNFGKGGGKGNGRRELDRRSDAAAVSRQLPRPLRFRRRLPLRLRRSLNSDTVSIVGPFWLRVFESGWLIEFVSCRVLSSGVIWKGDALIDGVSRTLDLLRSKVTVAFLSVPFPVSVRHWRARVACLKSEVVSACWNAGEEAGVRDEQLDQVEEAVREEVPFSRDLCGRGSFFVACPLLFCSFLLLVGSRSDVGFEIRSGFSSQDEIFSSSFAAAMYLKVNDFPQDKKVICLLGLILSESILHSIEAHSLPNTKFNV